MTDIEIIAIEHSVAYKGSAAQAKKYHLPNPKYASTSICQWGISKGLGQMVGLLKKEQLCKMCFKKYLRATGGEEKCEETLDPINNRWEILDFGT